MKRFGLFLLAALTGPALAAGPFTVNTTSDTHDSNAGDGACSDAAGLCSLRAALEQANASAGTTTINLPSGTYNLSLGDLVAGTAANTNIYIHGTGTSANTTINQTQAQRLVVNIDYNVTANVVFKLDNATITGGSESELDPDGFGGNGGAVLAGGSATATGNAVTFDHVVFSGNYCSPSANAGCSGGAINMTGGGDLTISNSTFTGNEAAKLNGSISGGGAVYFDAGFAGGNLTITNSIFTNNIAHNGQGGALYIGGGTSNSYTLTGNTFTGNTAGASAQGGAIIIFTGIMTAHYNRIVGNSAGTGSGLYMSFGDATPFRSVDARDNWWGCNGGPGAIGCDSIYPTTSTTPPLTNGQISFDPWIVLSHTASPGKIRINQSSTLTGSFLQDNHGAAISSGSLGVLVGLPITFNAAVLGTIPNAQPESIQAAGTATATFNAGSSGGNGSAHATVDNATVTANITILQPPSIANSFNPTTAGVNAASTATLSITNGNTVAINASFTDSLPTHLVVATTPNVISNCGGSVTATAGAATVSFSNPALAAGTCTIKVDLQGTSDGVLSNSVTIKSTDAGDGNTASADLTVINPPSIAKSFGAVTVPLNGTTSLTFTLSSSNTQLTLIGTAFNDSLPAGLVVATPGNLSNTCGGTPAAADGASSISLTGASLTPGATCTISANVKGTSAGAKNNSVSISSSNAGSGNTSNASLTVVAPPTVAKSFGAPGIALASTTSLGFTINNPNGTTTLSGIGVSDTLPSGLVISAPNGLTGSCGGGTITATQNTAVITLSGASLPSGASCNFGVNVKATSAGTKNNTTGNVTSIEGGAGTTASASLSVSKSSSSTTLTTECPTQFVANQPFTMTATVTAYNPTGNTTFDDSGNPIAGCASVALSSGTAICMTSGLAAGQRNLTAAYSGDSNNLSSNSASLFVDVLDPADVLFRNGFEAGIAGCPIE